MVKFRIIPKEERNKISIPSPIQQYVDELHTALDKQQKEHIDELWMEITLDKGEKVPTVKQKLGAAAEKVACEIKYARRRQEDKSAEGQEIIRFQVIRKEFPA